MTNLHKTIDIALPMQAFIVGALTKDVLLFAVSLTAGLLGLYRAYKRIKLDEVAGELDALNLHNARRNFELTIRKEAAGIVSVLEQEGIISEDVDAPVQTIVESYLNGGKPISLDRPNGFDI